MASLSLSGLLLFSSFSLTITSLVPASLALASPALIFAAFTYPGSSSLATTSPTSISSNPTSLMHYLLDAVLSKVKMRVSPRE